MARLIDAKTIPEALEIAKKMSGKIGDKETDKIKDLYAKYKTFIDKYRGALPPLSVAQGLMHESVGDPEHTSDPLIGESGLWSILPGQAMGSNFDPFDPESNIWAGGRLRNERVKEILSKWPWLAQSDPRDYTTITQKMPGSLGQGGFKQIMKLIFPKPPTGDRLKYPYKYMQAWVTNSANWPRIPTLGRQKPPLVAGRIYRDIAGEWLEEVGQLAVPGEYKLIPRPEHLPPFNPTRWAQIWGKKVAAMAKSSDKLYQGWYKQLVAKLGAGTVASMAGGQVASWKTYLGKIKKGKLASSAEAVMEAATSPFGLGTVAALAVLAGAGVVLWRRHRRGKALSGLGEFSGPCSGSIKHAHVHNSQFDPRQLARGIEVELEHTNSRKCAEAIVKGHLVEHPRYYDFLDEMEKKMKMLQPGSLAEFAGMFHGNGGSEGRMPILPPEQVPWAVQGKARPPKAPGKLKHGHAGRSERFTVLPPAPPGIEGLGALFGDPIDDRISASSREELETLRRDLLAVIKTGQHQIDMGGQKVLVPVVLGKVNARLKGGDFDGARWESVKSSAGRAMRAARSTARTSGVRMIKGQIQNVAGAAKIVMRHPEVFAGKVSPALVKELVEGGFIQRSTPVEMYKTAKDFVAQYQHAVAGFGLDSGLTCTCRGKTVVKPMQLRFLSCESFCKGK